MKTKTPKYFYTLHRVQGHDGYAHAVVRIYLHPAEDHNGRREILSVQWQSDSSQQEAKWYCPHLELRSDSAVGLTTVDQLSAAASLARRFSFDWNPLAFLKSLDAGGIPRRIFDDRVDRYLSIGELEPPDVVAWIARVEGQCVLKALGRNEKEAQDAASRAFGELIANPQRQYDSLTGATRKFTAWLTAGKPVERDRFGNAPEAPSVEELFKALGLNPPVQTPAPESAAA